MKKHVNVQRMRADVVIKLSISGCLFLALTKKEM